MTLKEDLTMAGNNDIEDDEAWLENEIQRELDGVEVTDEDWFNDDYTKTEGDCLLAISNPMAEVIIIENYFLDHNC